MLAIQRNDFVMETSADRLRIARTRAGFKNANDASDAFGWNKHTYTSHENGNRNFKLDSAIVYADAFGVDYNWLLSGRGDAPAARKPEAAPVAPKATPQPNAQISGPVPDYDVKVPVYGSARGGLEGHFVLNGQQLTDVLAPPALRGVKDAYAVFVAGDSMEPRYFAGEVVFVNPMIPVRRGDFVVIQVYQGEDEGAELHAFVKRFQGHSNGDYIFDQFNPHQDLSFPKAKVRAVHKIVGSSVQ